MQQITSQLWTNDLHSPQLHVHHLKRGNPVNVHLAERQVQEKAKARTQRRILHQRVLVPRVGNQLGVLAAIVQTIALLGGPLCVCSRGLHHLRPKRIH